MTKSDKVDKATKAAKADKDPTEEAPAAGSVGSDSYCSDEASEPIDHACLPLTYLAVELNLDDNNAYQLEDVVFNGDFGPFRRGDKVEFLVIDAMECNIEEYDGRGRVQRKMRFKMVAR